MAEMPDRVWVAPGYAVASGLHAFRDGVSLNPESPLYHREEFSEGKE